MASKSKAGPRSSDDLPFVSDQNFWNVTPTGGYQEDCRTGARYAGLLVRWMCEHRYDDGNPILGLITLDMPAGEAHKGPKAISSVWRGSPSSKGSFLSFHKKIPAQGGVSVWLPNETFSCSRNQIHFACCISLHDSRKECHHALRIPSRRIRQDCKNLSRVILGTCKGGE